MEHSGIFNGIDAQLEDLENEVRKGNLHNVVNHVLQGVEQEIEGYGEDKAVLFLQGELAMIESRMETIRSLIK